MKQIVCCGQYMTLVRDLDSYLMICLFCGEEDRDLASEFNLDDMDENNICE